MSLPATFPSSVHRPCEPFGPDAPGSSLSSVPPPPDRPAWLPQGDALQKLPPALQLAAERSIVPLWDEAVLRADTAVERSAGETFVYFAWLEIQQQAELAGGCTSSAENSPAAAIDVESVLNRLLGIARFKLAAGSFLLRAKERWKADSRREYLESLRDQVEAAEREIRRENEEFRELIEENNRAAAAAKKRVPGVEPRGTIASPPAGSLMSVGDPLAEPADQPSSTADFPPSQLDALFTQLEDRRRGDAARRTFARESARINATRNNSSRRELEKPKTVAQLAATNGHASPLAPVFGGEG